MNRYTNKRHQGPTHRGFIEIDNAMEGNIPVVLAGLLSGYDELSKPVYRHIRAFYCHPTKGWRSTGPEGNRK